MNITPQDAARMIVESFYTPITYVDIIFLSIALIGLVVVFYYLTTQTK